jgi:pilus assembly protein Flp/PilA
MRVSTVGLSTRDDGATATEYAIMLALIIVALILVIRAFGDTSSGIWANNIDTIQNAVRGP